MKKQTVSEKCPPITVLDCSQINKFIASTKKALSNRQFVSSIIFENRIKPQHKSRELDAIFELVEAGLLSEGFTLQPKEELSITFNFDQIERLFQILTHVNFPRNAKIYIDLGHSHLSENKVDADHARLQALINELYAHPNCPAGIELNIVALCKSRASFILNALNQDNVQARDAVIPIYTDELEKNEKEEGSLPAIWRQALRHSNVSLIFYTLEEPYIIDIEELRKKYPNPKANSLAIKVHYAQIKRQLEQIMQDMPLPSGTNIIFANSPVSQADDPYAQSDEVYNPLTLMLCSLVHEMKGTENKPVIKFKNDNLKSYSKKLIQELVRIIIETSLSDMSPIIFSHEDDSSNFHAEVLYQTQLACDSSLDGVEATNRIINDANPPWNFRKMLAYYENRTADTLVKSRSIESLKIYMLQCLNELRLGLVLLNNRTELLRSIKNETEFLSIVKNELSPSERYELYIKLRDCGLYEAIQRFIFTPFAGNLASEESLTKKLFENNSWAWEAAIEEQVKFAVKGYIGAWDYLLTPSVAAWVKNKEELCEELVVAALKLAEGSLKPIICEPICIERSTQQIRELGMRAYGTFIDKQKIAKEIGKNARARTKYKLIQAYIYNALRLTYLPDLQVSVKQEDSAWKIRISSKYFKPEPIRFSDHSLLDMMISKHLEPVHTKLSTLINHYNSERVGEIVAAYEAENFPSHADNFDGVKKIHALLLPSFKVYQQLDGFTLHEVASVMKTVGLTLDYAIKGYVESLIDTQDWFGLNALGQFLMRGDLHNPSKMLAVQLMLFDSHDSWNTANHVCCPIASVFILMVESKLYKQAADLYNNANVSSQVKYFMLHRQSENKGTLEPKLSPLHRIAMKEHSPEFSDFLASIGQSALFNAVRQRQENDSKKSVGVSDQLETSSGQHQPQIAKPNELEHANNNPDIKITEMISEACSKLGLQIEQIASTDALTIQISRSEIKSLSEPMRACFTALKAAVTQTKQVTLERKTLKGNGDTITLRVPTSQSSHFILKLEETAFTNTIQNYVNATQDAAFSTMSHARYKYVKDDILQIASYLSKVLFNARIKEARSPDHLYSIVANFSNQYNNDSKDYQLQRKNKHYVVSGALLTELAERLATFALLARFDATNHQLSIRLKPETMSDKVISNPSDWKSVMNPWLAKVTQTAELLISSDTSNSESSGDVSLSDSSGDVPVLVETESKQDVFIETVARTLFPSWADKFAGFFNPTLNRDSGQLSFFTMRDKNATVNLDGHLLRVDELLQFLAEQINAARFDRQSSVFSIHRKNFTAFVEVEQNLNQFAKTLAQWLAEHAIVHGQHAKRMITPPRSQAATSTEKYFSELRKVCRSYSDLERYYRHIHQSIAHLSQISHVISNLEDDSMLTFYYKAYAFHFERFLNLLYYLQSQGQLSFSGSTKEALQSARHTVRHYRDHSTELAPLFEHTHVISSLKLGQSKPSSAQMNKFDCFIESMPRHIPKPEQQLKSLPQNDDNILAEWTFVTEILSAKQPVSQFHIAAVAHSCGVIWQLARQAGREGLLDKMVNGNKRIINQVSVAMGHDFSKEPDYFIVSLSEIMAGFNLSN